jgi:trehalose 6-phosphate phosphatase
LPPKYLFDEWPSLVLDLNRSRTACILLDFDGTLSPFAKKPHLASIPAQAKRSLTALSSDPGIKIGVISGRSLADVKQMVGVPGIYYAGNHGLEVEGPGIQFVHPQADGSKLEVKKCASSLARKLKGFKGAIVEDKGLTASVHYRLVADEGIKPLLTAVESEVGTHSGLLLRHGKRVVEIRPGIEWGKGKAAELLIKSMGNSCLPVFFGDDETDEEAFASPMIHWSVKIMDQEAPTRARYCLRSVSEVRTFLRKLLSWSVKRHR